MKIPLALAVLVLLGGCASEEHWSLNAPPAEQPLPPPVHQKVQHVAAKPPASVASAGPLKVAMVGSYMDAQEKDFRTRLHGVAVMRVGDDLIVSLRDGLVFNDEGLSSRGRDFVEQLAQLMRHYDRTQIAIAGYTDSALTVDQSLALSRTRAKTIADGLIANGVAAGRVSSQGFGASHPKVTTGPGMSEPRNRRIEIRVIAHPQG
jgi:outer membrane protein OmpA-like peptidoglycan-associated protein